MNVMAARAAQAIFYAALYPLLGGFTTLAVTHAASLGLTGILRTVANR